MADCQADTSEPVEPRRIVNRGMVPIPSKGIERWQGAVATMRR